MVTTANRGFHPLLDEEAPVLFIDSCVQIWPDADFANMHRHGATVYGVTAWMPHASVSAALEGIMSWHLFARRHANIAVVQSVEDIRRVRADGQAGLLLAAQDGDFIGDRLHRVEAFYRLGLRLMLPAYNASNQICGGCLEAGDAGLTRFGELVVDECNRVGLLLDCTHTGRRSTLDIMARSSQPVVFSHSNPRALVDNPRNIDDEQIRACAAGGGVIGLASWGPLVKPPGQKERPTLAQFVEHIDYVAQLTGSADHIGIGTDMSLGTYPDHRHDPWGVPAYADVTSEYNRVVTADIRSPQRHVAGFSSYTEVLNLITSLEKRGYDSAAIQKILGENYLRVFGEVWRA